VYRTKYRYCTRQIPSLDYLEADHITVEALGLSQENAEALGDWIRPKGHDERLRCHSHQAPDGRTDRLHWGDRGKIAERISPFERGHISKEDCLAQ
jgi:hypothetical protein